METLRTSNGKLIAERADLQSASARLEKAEKQLRSCRDGQGGGGLLLAKESSETDNTLRSAVAGSDISTVTFGVDPFSLGTLTYSTVVHEADSPSATKYRVRPFFLASQHTSLPTDITIATQLTVDRLDRLVQMTQVWTGPISAAIYITNVNKDVKTILTRWHTDPTFRVVDIHLVFAVANSQGFTAGRRFHSVTAGARQHGLLVGQRERQCSEGRGRRCKREASCLFDCII